VHIVQPTVPNRDVLLHIVERAHRFDSLCVHSVVSFVHLARATVVAACLDFDLVAFISLDVFNHLVRQPFHSGDCGLRFNTSLRLVALIEGVFVVGVLSLSVAIHNFRKTSVGVFVTLLASRQELILIRSECTTALC